MQSDGDKFKHQSLMKFEVNVPFPMEIYIIEKGNEFGNNSDKQECMNSVTCNTDMKRNHRVLSDRQFMNWITCETISFVENM